MKKVMFFYNLTTFKFKQCTSILSIDLATFEQQHLFQGENLSLDIAITNITIFKWSVGS